jgi:hypothetical protein
MLLAVGALHTGSTAALAGPRPQCIHGQVGGRGAVGRVAAVEDFNGALDEEAQEGALPNSFFSLRPAQRSMSTAPQLSWKTPQKWPALSKCCHSGKSLNQRHGTHSPGQHAVVRPE